MSRQLRNRSHRGHTDSRCITLYAEPIVTATCARLRRGIRNFGREIGGSVRGDTDVPPRMSTCPDTCPACCWLCVSAPDHAFSSYLGLSAKRGCVAGRVLCGAYGEAHWRGVPLGRAGGSVASPVCKEQKEKTHCIRSYLYTARSLHCLNAPW